MCVSVCVCVCVCVLARAQAREGGDLARAECARFHPLHLPHLARPHLTPHPSPLTPQPATRNPQPPHLARPNPQPLCISNLNHPSCLPILPAPVTRPAARLPSLPRLLHSSLPSSSPSLLLLPSFSRHFRPSSLSRPPSAVERRSPNWLATIRRRSGKGREKRAGAKE